MTELDGVIDIAVPLRHEFASPLRVLVATAGADNGFSVDDIDDLRLAVSEVFTLLVEMGGSERCHASFRLSPQTVAITMGRDGIDDVIEFDELASAILASVVDRCEQSNGAVTLVKRADAPA